MKNSILLASGLSILLAASASAGLPAGSFKGTSPFLKGPDVMALIIKKDPANANTAYAVLAEYTRLPYIPGPERIEITKWVPRTFAYRIEPAGKLRYAMKPIRVSASGDIEVDNGHLVFGVLELKKDGTLDGATLTRYDRGSNMVAETIAFDGKVSSTWEDYVPGNYFGSKDPTGGDYLHKAVNMTLSKDKVAEFSMEDVKGRFDVAEKAPGIFVFRAKAPAAAGDKGKDKVEPMIGVFIDIVNWKPFFTTDELLLINPEDPKDVGFYYERH
ncbi:MAG: hypothetical protein AAB320_09430 [Elusimicrobiota bacterium]